MIGTASFGGQRQDLDPGDYTAEVVSVELGERDDFKDSTKKTPAYVWTISIQLRDGTWEQHTFRSSRTITNMQSSPPPQPHMISGVNRLIRACGMVVPHDTATTQAWDPRSLVGRRFIWHVEIEPETGQKIRKFLAMGPPPAQRQAQAAAEVAAVYAPAPWRLRAPWPTAAPWRAAIW